MNPGPRPHHRISNTTWALLQGLAGVLDVLKFGAASFVFVAPILAGSIAGAAWGSLVGWLVGAATATAEVAGAPVTAAIEAFGAASAVIIGLVGWIVMGGILMLKVIPLSMEDDGMQILIAGLVGFGFSELPLIDAIPTFTPTIWRIVHIIRKADKKKIAAWEAKNKLWLERQASERQAYLADYYRSQEIALLAETENAEQEQAEVEAANDNEIPQALGAAA